MQLFRPSIAITITASLLLSSCTDALYTSSKSSNTVEVPVEFTVNSMGDLHSIFEELQYSPENWNNASSEVPRILFNSIGENWVNESPQLPVNIKKSIFFRLMTPLILISNENILREREIVENAPLDAKDLISVALKYHVIKDKKISLTQTERQNLLIRVDILPASLALAQAAEESGWGTSRFALEGNAFFGQWDFSGSGMKPKQHRAKLGNYGVARFDSPFDSVEAYMFNLNTNRSYKDLRLLRAEERTNNHQVSGYNLAQTLTKYSERGEAYADALRHLIHYNKLESIDDMLLSNNKEIYLITATQ